MAVAILDVPKGAEFSTARRGATAKPADPKLITLLESGNAVYIRKADFTNSARTEFRRAADAIPDKDGQVMKFRTMSGQLSGEDVVKVWGEYVTPETVEAAAAAE